MKKSKSDTRARRAIEVVACPRCKAAIGTYCFFEGNRPGTHTERRQAYQAWRNEHHPNWNAEHGVKPITED